MDNISITERKLEQYLPILKEVYPNKRESKKDLLRFVEIYKEMTFEDNVIVGVYDNRTASLIFLSENFKQITNYDNEAFLNLKDSFLFKTIHSSHHSFPFVALKLNQQFFKAASLTGQRDIRWYCGGLKFVDGRGQIHRSFLKIKPLMWDEKNRPDITIFFGQNLNHLIKGNQYWMRYTKGNGKGTKAYIHQKGKKDFTDLVSVSERKVLELLAEKKTNTEIADILCLSKHTVETHRKNMINRIGAINSTALVHLCKMANVV